MKYEMTTAEIVGQIKFAIKYSHNGKLMRILSRGVLKDPEIQEMLKLSGVDKKTILNSFVHIIKSTTRPSYEDVGITDAKRLLSLAGRMIFTPEEIKPYIMMCDDAEAILMFKQKYPDSITDDEVLEKVNLRDIKEARVAESRREVLGISSGKSGKVSRLAENIKGLDDLLMVDSVMES